MNRKDSMIAAITAENSAVSLEKQLAKWKTELRRGRSLRTLAYRRGEDLTPYDTGIATLSAIVKAAESRLAILRGQAAQQ